MTPEQFAEKMAELQERYRGDKEFRHTIMDDLMCEVLSKLGYNEGVAIFAETPKWYA